MATSTSTNGTALAEPVILPASVGFVVNGAVLTAPVKTSKAGNAWYEGKQDGALNGADPQAALASMVCSFDGTDLTPGEVHISAPRVTREGKVQAGTGGNLTVTHSAIVDLGESKVPYQVMVTATVVTRKAKTAPTQVVSVRVKAYKRGTSRGVVNIGTLEGDLAF